MGEKLNEGAEVLFRQIHPTLFQNGEPFSASFIPSKKDADQLSVDRSTLTNAASSHALFTSTGLASVAVYGLTVGEFEAEKIPCFSDAIEKTSTQPANPAHAVANYAGHGKSKQKIIAKRLKLVAVNRGKLHP